MLLLYLYVTSSCRPFKSFLLEDNDIHYLGYKKLFNIEKDVFFRLVTSVGRRKNSESPRGIEPLTFGFRGSMLYL